MDLHNQSVSDLVRVIREEDSRVITAMALAETALSRFISAIEPRFTAGGRLIYLGAGTSGRLGVLDASEAPPTFDIPHDRIIGIIAGGDSALRRSSEGKEDNPDGSADVLSELNLTANDTVLGIASGGTTPYVLGAFRLAKQTVPDILTGMIVCASIPQPPYVEHLIVLDTGPEVLTGSTRMKGGTATKLALNTISTVLMIRSGRVYQNLMVDLRATNDKLRDRAARIISTLTGLDRGSAFELLDKADGVVKRAIVMQLRGVDPEVADRLLVQAGNRLDKVIG